VIWLRGKISDRLRNVFGMAVAEWPAARADDSIDDMAPANYTGVHLAPAGRRAKHRR
jgi:hypothetical protein